MPFLATFFISLAVSVALSLIAYALMPRPKRTTPDMARDMEMPTSEAGRPIPVVFGEGTVKSPNCLWYGDVGTIEQAVNI
ncbi:MAG TPA: hypothetical protein VKY70_05685 [Pseudomonas sp.]|nr:hypothetical protein [Pseudomonas sp.]